MACRTFDKYIQTRAKLAGLDRMADELVDIADDGKGDIEIRTNSAGEEYEAQNAEFAARSRLRVDTRKWLLSKLAPKKYGDKLAVGGDDDAPPIRQSLTVELIKPVG